MTTETIALVDLAVKVGTPIGFLAIVAWSAWMLVPASLRRMRESSDQGRDIAESLDTIANISTTTGELLVRMNEKLDLTLGYCQKAAVDRKLEVLHAGR